MSGSTPPAKKGILKQPAEEAARREEKRMRDFTAASQEITFKILVMGSDMVGKTSIVKSMSGDKQTETYEHTDGLQTTTMLAAAYQNRPVFLQIWEVPYWPYCSPGYTGDNMHLDILLHNVHAVLFCFDTTDASGAGLSSLEAVDACRDLIESRIINKMPVSDAADTAFPLYLLAHKADVVAPLCANALLPGQTTSPAAPKPPVHVADMLTAGQAQVKFGFGALNIQGFFGMDAGSSTAKAPAGTRSKLTGKAAESKSAAMPFAFGLDTTDLDAYATAAGYRNWFWTSIYNGAAAGPVAGSSSSILAMLTTIIDDLLECWGYVEGGMTRNSSFSSDLPSRRDSISSFSMSPAAPLQPVPSQLMEQLAAALPAASKAGVALKSGDDTADDSIPVF